MAGGDESSDPYSSRALELLWGNREEAPARGPKRALSVDTIVRTAIGIADAEGLEAVTMRRVATELGFTTMALYRYVPHKRSLVDLTVDTVGAAMTDVRLPPGWRDGLTAWVRAYLDVSSEHPWLLRMEIVGAPAGPNSVAYLEIGLRALDESGLPGGDKMAVLLALTGYVRGAAQIASGISNAASARGVADEDMAPSYGHALAKVVDGERFPRLAEVLTEGVFEMPEEQPDEDFEFGLARMLDGISVFIEHRRVGQ
ncbi:MAG: TetR family transcriptional regulator [Streptosporangiales bacterium]|nr:TetR family transcriptional regulator [Streptosporangiales bacterium]